MNSKIKFIFLFFIILNPLFLFGNDEVPIPIDTIELGNIRIFNQVLQTEFGLFTKHSNINNFSIIVKNVARYYPANNIPFNSFTDDMFFIIIYSEYFNYVFLDENNFDYIFIERVEPNDYIILTIQNNEFAIRLNKQTEPLDLGKYFVNSYRFFLNGENISNQFFLKVISDQQYAYLLLNFENNHFVDMFLLKEIAGFTD